MFFLGFHNYIFVLTKQFLDMARFNKATLESIKSDPELFAKVCLEMDVKATSLPMIIERNGNNLNQYSIVTLVAAHLGKNPDEVIEAEIKEAS